MDTKQKTIDLLAKFQCKKLRSKRHNIYLLPSGERYTTPQTASDNHSWDNCLAQLKVHLGISRQNKKAIVGTKTVKRKKTVRQAPSRYASIPAAPPIGFDFGVKVRAAMRGEKPTHPGPLTLKESIKPLPVKPRFRTKHEQRERHGAVRVWSKADIDAANIAMRAGKLTQFLQLHHQASQPATQPDKESTTMLGVDQIDATIAELDAGMATAATEQKREATEIHRLESEIAEARGRMEAASDKHNSLNDVKTSLSVLREDIEKVRPMLGMLAAKPVREVVHARRRAGLKVADAIRQVLDQARRPLRAGEIHKEVQGLAGGEGIAMSSIYTFLSLDVKKNGDALAQRIPADGSYWRAGRSMPQAGAA